jgi:hypothetical protein
MYTPNRTPNVEQRVVIALVSERDYDTVQAIVAWPIRWAGIFIASILFGLVIPAMVLGVFAIVF